MFESNYCVSAPRPLQGNDFRTFPTFPPTQGKNRDAPALCQSSSPGTSPHLRKGPLWESLGAFSCRPRVWHVAIQGARAILTVALRRSGEVHIETLALEAKRPHRFRPRQRLPLEMLQVFRLPCLELCRPNTFEQFRVRHQPIVQHAHPSNNHSLPTLANTGFASHMPGSAILGSWSPILSQRLQESNRYKLGPCRAFWRVTRGPCGAPRRHVVPQNPPDVTSFLLPKFGKQTLRRSTDFRPEPIQPLRRCLNCLS